MDEVFGADLMFTITAVWRWSSEPNCPRARRADGDDTVARAGLDGPARGGSATPKCSHAGFQHHADTLGAIDSDSRALVMRNDLPVLDAERRVQQADGGRDRISLAMLLLMGDSGLRRAETVSASRNALTPSRHVPGIWMLKVLGKGRNSGCCPLVPALLTRCARTGLIWGRILTRPAMIAHCCLPWSYRPRRRRWHAMVMGRRATVADTAGALYDVVTGASRRVHGDLQALGAEAELSP